MPGRPRGVLPQEPALRCLLPGSDRRRLGPSGGARRLRYGSRLRREAHRRDGRPQHDALRHPDRKSGMNKFQQILTMIEARLQEQSTWQGIGFLVGLTGAKWGIGMDWGAAAGLGGIISAVLKIVFPDPKP